MINFKIMKTSNSSSSLSTTSSNPSNASSTTSTNGTTTTNTTTNNLLNRMLTIPVTPPNLIRKANPNMIAGRNSMNFSSTSNIHKSKSNKDMFSNSFDFAREKRDSVTMSTLKFRRSGSITTFFTQEDTNNNINNKSLNANSNTITTISPIVITGTLNNNMPSFSLSNNLFRNNKFIKASNYSPYHTKRHKANQLSLIDYCNIINLNTNFQMLTNVYQEPEDPMAKLNMRANRNGNIQKQASIAEQMAILFGSTMCTCYLCKLKLGKNGKRHQKHHFEITPSKNNALDYSIAKYTYSSPYSQLSTLKLFNIMNTDCSIYFSTEACSNLNGSSTNSSNNSNNNNSISFNLTNTTNTSTNNSTTNGTNTNAPFNQANTSFQPTVSCNATTYPLYSYNPSTTTIISSSSTNGSNSCSNPSTSNVNQSNQPNNGSSISLTLKNLMHVSTNTPPIYDSRYLYLIDCRVNKNLFKRHRIYTAIHYSDILNDMVYLSPPSENYTLIVLYDETGRMAASSSTSCLTSYSLQASSNVSRLSDQTFNTNDMDDMSESDKTVLKRDEIITALRAKLNCSPNQTIYILSGGYEEFYSKFPFMCSNIDIRSTADRNKYLTIYPNCVIENQMYIGSGIQAKNWKIIRDLNITHIINCSIEHECVFQDELTYLHVKLEDNHQENIYKFLTKTLRFIEDAFDKYYEEVYKSENSIDFSIDSGINSATSSKSSNMNTNNSSIKPKPPVFLIHCNLGISRSSSILIAYLISKYKICLYSAFKYVKDKRLQIAPNYSFLKQLKQFEDAVI